MRLSKTGKTASLEIDFWFNPEDQAIHIATNDPRPRTESFRLSVSNVAGRRDAHPSLFRQLAKCLRSMGAPAPDDKLTTGT